MTTLQQLAFERIATLNKSVRELLPKTYDIRATSYNISMAEFHEIGDHLYEQSLLIQALDEENQREQ